MLNSFILELWIEEVPNQSCQADRISHNYIYSQIECQALCEVDNDCVGISWSIKEGTHWCHVCKNDIIYNAVNNYGFYRKQSGNNEFYSKFCLENILTMDNIFDVMQSFSYTSAAVFVKRFTLLRI